jgi:alkanesulfonate monooxygenase SsuD/methylene tetrahydromethanopterin reductase-like flavin-dependent oxidoreductase (luciferase family)
VTLTLSTVVGFQNPARWRRPWAEVYATSLEFAALGERLGLDRVWLTEHHFVDDGYCPSLLPAAAAIAARTERIRIGTKVMLLPFHDPIRLAEDAAVVDIVSNGRLDLGVAAGYRQAEFDGFGVPRSQRGQRMEEHLEVLTAALRGEVIEHAGRFLHYHGARVVPAPVQQPLPLWHGGRAPTGIARGVRHRCQLQLADFDVDRSRQDLGVWFAALQAEGLQPDAFDVSAVASVFCWPDAEDAWQLAGDHLLYQQQQYQTWFAESADRGAADSERTVPGVEDLDRDACLVGTPESIVERILSFHGDVPFDDFSFWTLLPGIDPGIASESLSLFAAEVAPALRAALASAPASAPDLGG